MRGKINKLSAPAIVSRALQYVGRPGINYHLEYPNGGTDPDMPPQDLQTGDCDCIGFAVNRVGFDRFQPKKFQMYGGYINTDSMIEEATAGVYRGDDLKAYRGGQWFTVLDKPEPGCFIVAHTFRRWLRRVIGHIGVVTDCSEYVTKGLSGIHVVHCSPGNVNRPGNVGHSAVWKTDGTVWAGYPKAYFIRFNADYAMGLK